MVQIVTTDSELKLLRSHGFEIDKPDPGSVSNLYRRPTVEVPQPGSGGGDAAATAGAVSGNTASAAAPAAVTGTPATRVRGTTTKAAARRG